MAKKEMSPQAKVATVLGVGSLILGACNLPGAPERPATPTLKPTVTGTPTAETFSQEEVATLMAEAILTDVAGRPVEVVTATSEPTKAWTMTPEASPTLFSTMTNTELVEEINGQIEAGQTFQVAGWNVTFPELAFADRGNGTAFIEDFYHQVEGMSGLEKKMEFWRMFPNGFTEKELKNYKLFGYNYEIVSENGKLFLRLDDQQVEIVDHGDGEYGFPHGAEFGMHEHQFCGTGNELDRCNFTVAAGGYALITGEGSIEELDWASSGYGGRGSALLIINVGEVSSNFGSDAPVSLDNVYLQSGRYFDGNQLPIEEIMAHTNNNMLNQDTDLNISSLANAGANCSIRNGCESVASTVFIVSGNEVLARFETVMSK